MGLELVMNPTPVKYRLPSSKEGEPMLKVPLGLFPPVFLPFLTSRSTPLATLRLNVCASMLTDSDCNDDAVTRDAERKVSAMGVKLEYSKLIKRVDDERSRHKRLLPHPA